MIFFMCIIIFILIYNYYYHNKIYMGFHCIFSKLRLFNYLLTIGVLRDGLIVGCIWVVLGAGSMAEQRNKSGRRSYIKFWIDLHVK